MSLIAMEMFGAQLVSPESEAWLLATEKRWQRIRRQLQEAPIKAPIHTFAMVWHWLDTWGAWRTALTHLALQRATVFGGRENTASGLVKARIFSSQWAPFLGEVQGRLRNSPLPSETSRVPTADETNLSRSFAERIEGIADELSEFLLSTDEPGLTQEQSVLANWIRALHVNPTEIRNRVSNLSVDRAARWLSGIEPLEEELSLAQIKRIFFLGENTSSAEHLA